MSEFTLDGVLKAIQAHVDDEADLNNTVVSFVIGAHCAEFENDNLDVHSYWFLTPTYQANHITLGMIGMLQQWAVNEPLNREDD